MLAPYGGMPAGPGVLPIADAAAAPADGVRVPDADIDPVAAERKQNEQYRTSCLEACARTHVAFDSFLYAVFYRRHAQVLTHALFVSGEKWDKMQDVNEARLAKVLEQGGRPSLDQRGRRFRLEELYEAKKELEFIARIEDLMSQKELGVLAAVLSHQAKPVPSISDVRARSRSHDSLCGRGTGLS